jgi:hypothetical protein
MKKLGKPKKTAKPKTAERVTARRAGAKLMTLAEFGKISAIEGLHMSREMRGTFRNLERKGASTRERRAVLVKKYGTVP